MLITLWTISKSKLFDFVSKTKLQVMMSNLAFFSKLTGIWKQVRMIPPGDVFTLPLSQFKCCLINHWRDCFSKSQLPNGKKKNVFLKWLYKSHNFLAQKQPRLTINPWRLEGLPRVAPLNTSYGPNSKHWFVEKRMRDVQKNWNVLKVTFELKSLMTVPSNASQVISLS